MTFQSMLSLINMLLILLIKILLYDFKRYRVTIPCCNLGVFSPFINFATVNIVVRAFLHHSMSIL